MPGWRGSQDSGKPGLQQSILQLQEGSWGFLPAPQGAQMAGDQPLELCCWREGVWGGGRASVHQHIHGENEPPAALLPARAAPPLHRHQFTLTHLGRQRQGQLLQERLWEQGKALGERKPKEPEELRTSDGSQHVWRPRSWSLENLSAVGHSKSSGSKAAGSVARGARLESWPGVRGGVRIW